MADNVTTQSTTPATAPAGEVIAADDVGGVKHQRVKVSLGADGSATDLPGDGTFGADVDVTRLPALPAGTNNIGDVDVLTVPADPFGTNADAAAAAGGTGSISAKLRIATSLLNNIFNEVQNVTVTEDLAHASGDLGIGAMAVRKDAAGTLVSADGDYSFLQVDANGNLRVTGGGGGTQFAEDAAHTTGDLGTAALAVRKDAAGTLVGTDGDYAMLQVDANGNLRVTGAGGGTQYTEADSDATPTGTVAMGLSPTNTTLALRVNASGYLEVVFAEAIEVTGEVEISADVAVLTITPTISTTIYADGDSLAGLMSLSNAYGGSGEGAALHSLVILDRAVQKAAFDILFFDASATIPAANAAFAWTAGDDLKVLHCLHVPGGDYDADTNPLGYHTIVGKAFCVIPSIGMAIQGNATSALYMAVIVRGTPTYANNNDLVFRIGNLQD